MSGLIAGPERNTARPNGSSKIEVPTPGTSAEKSGCNRDRIRARPDGLGTADSPTAAGSRAAQAITKITWDNAAQLSPRTAKRLGISNHDVVELSGSRSGSVRAPAWDRTRPT